MIRHDLKLPLPNNETKLENAFAKLSDSLFEIENPTRSLFDAWEFPAEFLPYLAWANSVDVWDENWSEIEKRREIDAAAKIHRLKGTVAGVKSALNRLAVEFDITEWWQSSPNALAGTFKVFMDAGIENTQGFRKEAVARLNASKPKSRSYALKIGVSETGPLGIACATSTRSTIVAEPFVFDGDLEHIGPLGLASATITQSTITSEAA